MACQNISRGELWNKTCLTDQYRNWEKAENMGGDIPDFQVDFFKFLDEEKGQ